MPAEPRPRSVEQVMVSSTFTDLEEHRAALILALHKNKLHANVMEHDDAKAGGDVIDSSLRMVAESAAYILVIGQKYGQTPEDPVRNPDQLSITELEFNEAVRLERPVLLFVMGAKHPLTIADIERDPEKVRKLDAFRERAKRASPGGKVNRVYAKFSSLEEFKDRIGPSLTDLCRTLDATAPPAPESSSASAPADPNAIPTAPALYAEPRYIGSHTFVGRDSQLQELSDWAKPADPTTLLLFEAIGGNGKSMLTWEWVNNYAPAARPADAPWAGRFWYSFYERGAVMADFCQRALAYTTGRPLKEFARKKTTELAEQLLAQLTARPWLFILDGLERVLVAYHRIDAAEVPDEEANAPTDKIANRNPCDAIREEDNDLLRALAGARPSKILVSSRLTPRVLLNQAQQTIPGVKRINLLGLRPVDAEALLKSCGVTGDSAAIQQYLTENCDNHPLVVGVLAGLINKPGPCRGNFDAWAADPAGGASLDLGRLDLIQRRNHILRAAIEAVPPAGRQLLATLALINDSVDYATLEALNPHLPPEPKEVRKPNTPELHRRWKQMTEGEKAELRVRYEADLARRKGYEEAVSARHLSAEYLDAPERLADTVSDLEHRGLLQWDGRDRRYNLHPVVRGVVAGGMEADDRDQYGQRVVDHFSAVSHAPYEQATTLDELRPGLHVVRTLLKLGRFQQALGAYQSDLSIPLLFNLEEHREVLSLLRPFFRGGWCVQPPDLDPWGGALLANHVASALIGMGEGDEAAPVSETVLNYCLAGNQWQQFLIQLSGLVIIANDAGRLARSKRLSVLGLDLAMAIGDVDQAFVFRGRLFFALSLMGWWVEAASLWDIVAQKARPGQRNLYLSGDIETKYAEYQFMRGELQVSHLATAERLATDGKSRHFVRRLHVLAGKWRLVRGEWGLAAERFAEAVRMARERGEANAIAETGLALARHHLGDPSDPRGEAARLSDLRDEAERLAQLRDPAHYYLAILWRTVDNPDRAKHHALAAYKEAWADGEPYVRRYDLTKAAELLRELGAPIPNLPPYNPDKDLPAPWEADVRAAIDKLRAEKEAEEKESE